MHDIYRELSRRNLLRYLGSSIVFLPFLRTIMETQAYGQAGGQRKAVFFYYPDGIIREEFHPAETGADFKLPPMTAPLGKVKDDIIILKNTNYSTSNSHQGGVNYGLTGMPDSKKGISIDTYLGEKFKGTLPVLRLGIASNYEGGTEAKAASWTAGGTPSIIEDNPTKAFRGIFGGNAALNLADTTGLSPKLKKSLLDSNMQQIKGLQSKLGTIEKQKLDMHIEAIRELERQVDAVIGMPKPKPMDPNDPNPPPTDPGGPSQQCTRTYSKKKEFAINDTNYPKEYWKFENYDVVADLMNEIAVQALACNVTNVVYIQHSHSVSNVHFVNGNPGNGGAEHHTNSHYGAEGNRAAHIQGQAYMMGKYANLIEALRKVRQGDKSILYHTSMLAFSELADSDKHDFLSVGTVLAGQSGGFFKTGRCVDGGGVSHNQTLVSILQAMGLPDSTFGDPAKGSGIIPGLKG